jgi:hypothetical protein
MADPRAFISFDFDHNDTEKMLFVGQAKNSKTPFDIQDWSSKSALPQEQWKAVIKSKIGQTNMVIVLVGKFMVTATGVVQEIKMAQESNVPVFGVYVGGADTTSNLPDGLARNRVIGWGWGNIASAVSQMMGEGKNK